MPPPVFATDDSQVHREEESNADGVVAPDCEYSPRIPKTREQAATDVRLLHSDAISPMASSFIDGSLHSDLLPRSSFIPLSFLSFLATKVTRKSYSFFSYISGIS